MEKQMSANHADNNHEGLMAVAALFEGYFSIDWLISGEGEMKRDARASEKLDSVCAAFLEGFGDGMMIVQDGVRVFCNRAMERITGYSLSDLEGEEVGLYATPEDRIRIKHIVERFSTGTVISGDEPDPSFTDQPFVVSFEVSAAASTPTGSVSVTEDVDMQSCTGILADGQGSCELVLSTAGSTNLTATYSGDQNHLPSMDVEAHTAIPAVKMQFLPLVRR